MTSFVRQVRWELRKLWWRPRTLIGFGAAFAFELGMLALLRLPVVREAYLQRIWRLQQHLDVRTPFSALSNAVEVTGQTMLYVGAIAVVTIAGDLVAREIEDGTLRMALSRPVTRTSVLAQKLVACISYVVAMVGFVGATTLLLALCFERPGQLVVTSAREGIVGIHETTIAMARYAAAIPLLAVSMLTVAVLAIAIGCLPLRPATATMVTVMLLFADWMVNIHPALAAVSPYTLMTRITSWRQVFNQEIPWPRLERNYGELAILDVVLLGIAWIAFRRRTLTPR